MTVRVLIVDDHAGFRAGARRMLQAAGYAVVGEAADAVAAVAETRRLRPEVVLLDVQLPGGDGISVAARIARDPDGPKIILISSREASDYGSRLADAAVAGFIHKPDLSRGSLDRLIHAP